MRRGVTEMAYRELVIRSINGHGLRNRSVAAAIHRVEEILVDVGA